MSDPVLHISVEAFRPKTTPKLVRYDVRIDRHHRLSATREVATTFLEDAGLTKSFVRGLVTQARVSLGEEIDVYI